MIELHDLIILLFSSFESLFKLMMDIKVEKSKTDEHSLDEKAHTIMPPSSFVVSEYCGIVKH